MSQRERWIVYPQLFFSFTLAIRDQWPTTDQVPEFNVLYCKRLEVHDGHGRPAVVIDAKEGGSTEGSGVVTVYGGSSQVGGASQAAVRLFVTQRNGQATNQFGTVETYGPLGSRATKLTSDQTGGALHMFDHIGKPKQILVPLRPSTPLQPSPPLPEPENELENPREVTPRPPIPDSPVPDDNDSANTTDTAAR